MTTKSKIISGLIAIACLNSSCTQKDGTDKEQGYQSSVENQKKSDTENKSIKEIQLVHGENKPDFEEATLSLVGNVKDYPDDGKTELQFKVEHYELMDMTPNPDSLASSNKGQHIHAIIDNQPYTAHYNKKVELELEEGWHLGLFFLSKSYHESIKNGKAHVLVQFGSGKKFKKKAYDLTQPMLFYSRPKGEYEKKDADKILLDFFILNTQLKLEGPHIKLTVNDEEEFDIYEWKPYYLTGLPQGKNKIEMKLVDAEGKLIPSPANHIIREITIK